VDVFFDFLFPFVDHFIDIGDVIGKTNTWKAVMLLKEHIRTEPSKISP
jgi:hypothetical protein